ncbi:response regulator [Kriegella aquimaris]|uniref:CheY chemotaxis protein or a CheY-like REC (Receiver) domain n=1 Tax=Kriegella aquimaris TaxID=192904 RepID=A0A1G9J1I5_9FLAO|nr:response regulator [Kriegella aquimaris]SDL31136.1 CheY chemotaxis protein or a CheY-like REC (receiver) domain [Kriegella aquimaris]
MQLKVLIIEDNFIIQMFLESIIIDMGHEVANTVDNSEDALAFIEVSKPNLILLDIGISGERDGIETSQIIYERHKIPVVFITGNSDESTLERARRTNPIHIIHKPIDDYKLKSEFEIIFEKLIIAS